MAKSLCTVCNIYVYDEGIGVEFYAIGQSYFNLNFVSNTGKNKSSNGKT